MDELLEAIQKGIRQSFMIDSETEDEEFVKSKVASGNILNKVQEQYDQLFLNKKYEQCAELFKKYNGCLTPCKLANDGFYKLDLIEGLNCEDYSWVDLSNFINYIDIDGNQIPIHEVKDPNNILFIHTYNNTLIPINADELKRNLQFQKVCEFVKDKNGYTYSDKGEENTKRIVDFYNEKHINDAYQYAPAAFYCNRQKIVCENEVYQGYLPSIDEFNRLFLIENILRYAFINIGKTPMQFKNTQTWTSSDFDQDQCFCLVGKIAHGSYKTEIKQVYPFFK